ncbi:MAG TPA: hypothetical protein VN541_03890, partial [Tepidisphaeraceae bacterium]|nr:hypothetical protein [Tepidisphaeraceae bacterium]
MHGLSHFFPREDFCGHSQKGAGPALGQLDGFRAVGPRGSAVVSQEPVEKVVGALSDLVHEPAGGGSGAAEAL